MNDYGKLRVTRGEPIFAKGQILEVLRAHLIRIFMGSSYLMFIGITHGTGLFFGWFFLQNLRFSEKHFFGRFDNGFMKAKDQVLLKVVNY